MSKVPLVLCPGPDAVARALVQRLFGNDQPAVQLIAAILGDDDHVQRVQRQIAHPRLQLRNYRGRVDAREVRFLTPAESRVLYGLKPTAVILDERTRATIDFFDHVRTLTR